MIFGNFIEPDDVIQNGRRDVTQSYGTLSLTYLEYDISSKQ